MDYRPDPQNQRTPTTLSRVEPLSVSIWRLELYNYL